MASKVVVRKGEHGEVGHSAKLLGCQRASFLIQHVIALLVFILITKYRHDYNAPIDVANLNVIGSPPPGQGQGIARKMTHR